MSLCRCSNTAPYSDSAPLRTPYATRLHATRPACAQTRHDRATPGETKQEACSRLRHQAQVQAQAFSFFFTGTDNFSTNASISGLVA